MLGPTASWEGTPDVEVSPLKGWRPGKPPCVEPTYPTVVTEGGPVQASTPAPTNTVGGDTIDLTTAAGGTTAAPAPTNTAGGNTVCKG